MHCVFWHLSIMACIDFFSNVHNNIKMLLLVIVLE